MTMKLSPLRVLLRSPLFINTLVGGIIGAALGSADAFLPWLLGGLALGALLGWGGDRLLRRVMPAEKMVLRRVLIIVLFECLLVIYAIVPIYSSWTIVHPQRQVIFQTPADFGMAYEDVTVTTSDGVQLAGWYIPSKNQAAVLMLHGSNSSRMQPLNHAAVLSMAGYGVLLLDMRGHGQSGGDIYLTFDNSADVQAGVAFLQNRPDVDPARIGGLGLSLGGMAMLQGAAKEPALRAVMADGAGLTRMDDYFPLTGTYQALFFMLPMVWVHDRAMEGMCGQPATSMVENVTRIFPRPVLLVAAGEGDEPYMIQKMAASQVNVQVWELPNSQHTLGLYTDTEAYKKRMLEFFNHALLAAQNP